MNSQGGKDMVLYTGEVLRLFHSGDGSSKGISMDRDNQDTKVSRLETSKFSIPNGQQYLYMKGEIL